MLLDLSWQAFNFIFIYSTQCLQKFAVFALTTATLMESSLNMELKATNSLTQLLKPNGQLNYRLKRGSTCWCLSPGHVTFHFCGKNNVSTFRKNVFIYYLPDRVEKCLRYFGMGQALACCIIISINDAWLASKNISQWNSTTSSTKFNDSGERMLQYFVTFNCHKWT